MFESPRAFLSALPRFAQSAHAFEALASSAQFREQLLEHIAKAQRRIYIAALYLQNDAAGDLILSALYAAKARQPQLEIAVFVDWHRAQRGLIGAKAESGNAAWYQQRAQQHHLEVPIYGVPVQSRELLGVLHLKGFVIDDKVIYSGASLNNVYLHVGDRYRYDRYHVLHNPALAESMVHFFQTALLSQTAVHRLDRPNIPSTKAIRGEIRHFRQHLKAARYSLQGSSNTETGLAITPWVGVGQRNPLNRLILKLISASERKIVICTPYFNLPRSVTKALNSLIKKGVQIDLIIGDKTANDFYIPPSEPFKTIGALPYLYEANLRRFAKVQQKAMQAGQLNILLWHDIGHSFHLKGIWVDDDYQLLTGNNLNPRAFNLDLENALLIHDPQGELSTSKAAELQQIRQHTRRIASYTELETLADYPEKVKKLLTRLSRIRVDRLLSRFL
ncbi:CDP-diacylglycerol--serine O-phosphatidyltransferase [Deefgea piscis]|uniref:CDP-diacylglycerol--serine O-phosphatidyltransferase n=1 Tax=Deefgea piscis TaxID=2739061 RepID=UPI001C2DE8F4|nr:CDP-diacylglycerol--serine O-phosphatidyltransferase [Deefgea piscis]